MNVLPFTGLAILLGLLTSSGCAYHNPTASFASTEEFRIRSTGVLVAADSPSEWQEEAVFVRSPSIHEMRRAYRDELVNSAMGWLECDVDRLGTPRNCAVSTDPDANEYSMMFADLAGHFRVAPSATREKGARSKLWLYLYVENANGVADGRSRCAPPICSTVPAPPADPKSK